MLLFIYYWLPITLRTKQRIHESLEKGICTNRAPGGYKNVKIDDKHKYVEEDKSKSKIIKQIFSQVAKGVETPIYIRKQFAKSD